MLGSARIYANLALGTLHLEGVNGMTQLLLCLRLDRPVSEFIPIPGRDLKSIRSFKSYETVLFLVL